MNRMTLHQSIKRRLALSQWSITWRIAASVLVAAGVILGSVVGYGYISARRMLEAELAVSARQIAGTTASRIEAVEVAVEKVVHGLALTVENHPPQSREEIFQLLRQVVGSNSEIYGAAVAMEPYGLPGVQMTAPYVFRQQNELKTDDLAKEGYGYHHQDWYTVPRELKKAVWSEPYFDEGGGGVVMVTYSVPVFRDSQKKTLLGVVTCDISLDWLAELLRAMPLGEGYAFIISHNGTFISHPQKELILSENIFDRALRSSDESLRRLGQQMTGGQAGFIPYSSPATGKEGWLVYLPVAASGWSLGVMFPRDELMNKVADLARKEIGVGLAGFGALLVLVLAIARSITRPLRQLDQSARDLSRGDLDAPIPYIAGADEVARLAESFSIMRSEIKVYMEVLAETAAAKERIESELRIARDIQMSLVPKTFPPFPCRDDFEIYALMEPAKEVGGDFYDFFMPDDNHLCVAIGDVSGKGVPAALFMAVTRSFLRAFFRDDRSPGATLARLNDELSKDNDSCMFVTLFCAVIHLPSGSCRYANGGHNLPMRIHRDGRVTQLARTKGVALGAMEGLSYTEREFTINSGETLFFYTDGVTEAMNREGKWLGDERTAGELSLLREKNCTELLRDFRGVIGRFAEGAEQSDDITMVALRIFEKRKL